MGKEKKKTIKVFDNFHITHHAYVDFLDLFKGLSEWFGSNKYYFYESGISEKDLGTGYNVESTWTGERMATDYIKYKYLIWIHGRDVRKVVFEDGRETHWARLVIRINTEMVKNYNGTFKSNKWGEMMRQFYEKLVVGPEMSMYEGKLLYESQDLVRKLKSYLK